ncbi:hypothetical protein MHBO_001536 [Bonamia ostreae]|uniref:C3HC-type domain-containing protein n=1 Tax=Bonamia ostreae TaxID=126728 RepID=A0ABV2AK67_9EUKA
MLRHYLALKGTADPVEGALQFFEDRLSSFRRNDWEFREPPLDPFSCACEGWTAISKNKIQCGFCSETILCYVPTNAAKNSVAKITEFLHNKIVRNHKTDCDWFIERDEDFLGNYFLLLFGTHFVVSLENRLQKWLKYPELQIKSRIKFCNNLSKFVANLKFLSLLDGILTTVPRIMSFCGWEIMRTENDFKAECSYCFKSQKFTVEKLRRYFMADKQIDSNEQRFFAKSKYFGFSKFESKSSFAPNKNSRFVPKPKWQPSAPNENRRTRKPQNETVQNFDPILSHFKFCPLFYINSNNKNGLSIFLNGLINDANRNKKTLREISELFGEIL